jgi:hypothetical protein
MLPPGCPVEPLGKRADLLLPRRSRQLVALDPQKHGKTHIIALFGRKGRIWCDEFWPRSPTRRGDGKPIVTGWKPEIAAEILMGACAQCGIFDPQGKVRGTGAHRATTASSCSIAATRSSSPGRTPAMSIPA